MNSDQFEGGLRYTKGKVVEGAGDVVGNTGWQVDGIVDQIAGGAQNLYGRARETVKDAIEDAPDALADTRDKAAELARRGRSVADDQVHDNPWLLIAAAGAIGYAAAWLFHGARD